MPGLSEESMLAQRARKDSLAGYLELHMEQGKRLERAGMDIGIVSAIVVLVVSPVIYGPRRSCSGQPLWTIGLMRRWVQAPSPWQHTRL